MIALSRLEVKLRLDYRTRVQRLYSMFPAGAPGAALLLLRVTAAIVFALLVWNSEAVGPARFRFSVCVLAAALICLGLFTPICSVIFGLIEGITMSAEWRTQSKLVVLWLPVSLCIALLGPGAFSLDARLFGRKRIRPSAED